MTERHPDFLPDDTVVQAALDNLHTALDQLHTALNGPAVVPGSPVADDYLRPGVQAHRQINTTED